MKVYTHSIFDAEINTKLDLLESCIEANPNKSNNLYGGNMGKLLYYYYRAIHSDDIGAAEKSKTLFHEVLDIVVERKDLKIWNCSLGSGLAGFGIVMEVLLNEGFLDDQFEDYLIKIDDLVYQGAMARVQKRDLDFLHGGSGAFHYLFYRLSKNPKVVDYLTDFVLALQDISVGHDKGAYFPNSFLNTINYSPPEEVNLGLSHGMTSSVLILINLFEKGIATDICLRLIEGSVKFILSYFNTEKYQAGKYSHFPNSIYPDQSQYSTQNMKLYEGGLRWCYGDMNIAHLLYKASNALNRPEWREVADHVGLTTLKLTSLKDAGCHRSYFCHGTSGVAYYYKYLSRISGNDTYLIGYEYWLKKTLELLENEIDDEKITSQSGQFLEGFIGTSLVLMSEVSYDNEPLWEKVWLLE